MFDKSKQQNPEIPSKDYTKSENHYKSKFEISDNSIEISDADARLIDVMGNMAKYEYLVNNNTVSIMTNINQNEAVYEKVKNKDNSNKSTTVYINNEGLSKVDKETSSLLKNSGDIEIQVERYEIKKSVNHTDCGLNAAILEHHMSNGESEIILWADGSKGVNNFSDSLKEGITNVGLFIKNLFSSKHAQQGQSATSSSSLPQAVDGESSPTSGTSDGTDKNKLTTKPLGFWATVRELIQDWVIADLATAFGKINEQTKHLREFAMEYMYGHVDEPKGKKKAKTDKYLGKQRKNKIDRAVGVSLAAIALSTLGFTNGFEDTQISAYSGGTTKKLHDKAIKHWGNNGLGGSNIKNFFTPREFLSQILKYYKENNKFYIQKESGSPNITQHGGIVYTHNNGQNMTYYEMDYKQQAVFWPWHIVTPIDSLKTKFGVPSIDPHIQNVSNRRSRKRRRQGGISSLPVPSFYKNPPALEIPSLSNASGNSYASAPSHFPLPTSSSQENNFLDFISRDFKNFLSAPPPGCSPLTSPMKTGTENVELTLQKHREILSSLPSQSKRLSQIPVRPITPAGLTGIDSSMPELFPQAHLMQKQISPIELERTVEKVVTNILDDFIIRVGYEMHDYS